MNIYLSGSISGGRQKIETYIRIKAILESMGHRITSPQTADPHITDAGEDAAYDPQFIFERDIRQISESDMMLAEVTVPSLGVGYEIAEALHRNLPVLCIYDLDYSPKRISAMIEGNSSPLIKIKGYRDAQLESFLRENILNPK